MPGWIQAILGAAALVTAMGVLWTKLFRPGMKAANSAEEMLPLLKDLTIKFRDIPQVFDILKEIVTQVRTDSGSSLLDTINKLEDMMRAIQVTMDGVETRALAAAHVLQVGLEADRKLDERDREQMVRLLREQDRLGDRLARMESGAGTVADNLATAKLKIEGVATDLAASHKRADEVEGPHGAAGDAASRSGDS